MLNAGVEWSIGVESWSGVDFWSGFWSGFLESFFRSFKVRDGLSVTLPRELGIPDVNMVGVENTYRFVEQVEILRIFHPWCQLVWMFDPSIRLDILSGIIWVQMFYLQRLSAWAREIFKTVSVQKNSETLQSPLTSSLKKYSQTRVLSTFGLTCWSLSQNVFKGGTCLSYAACAFITVKPALSGHSKIDKQRS